MLSRCLSRIPAEALPSERRREKGPPLGRPIHNRNRVLPLANNSEGNSSRTTEGRRLDGVFMFIFSTILLQC